MSWSVSVSSQTAEGLEDYMQETFDTSYPDPDSSVKDQFGAAMKALDGLKNSLGKSDHWAASASGHAQTSDQDTVGEYIAVRVEKNIAG